MAHDENLSNIVYVPLENVLDPPNGLIEHYKNYYWFVHPERGLVFWKTFRSSQSPQCNKDRKVLELMQEQYPWAIIKKIPSVFLKVNSAAIEE
jgi:hypothetical protein